MIHLYAHLEHLEGKKRNGRQPSASSSYAIYEYKTVKRGLPDTEQPCHAPCSGRTGERQLGSGRCTLGDDLAAKTEELGRSPAGRRRHRAGLLDQPLLIDEAAEILLVQPPP